MMSYVTQIVFGEIKGVRERESIRTHDNDDDKVTNNRIKRERKTMKFW